MTSVTADRARARPIPVLRLSAALRERIEAAPVLAGRVHSVFERCLNIEWHDGRLLALHGPGRLAAPFAASLGRLPRGVGLRAGAAVWRQGRRLRVADVELDAARAAWVDLSIRPGSGDPRLLAETLASLAPLATGAALGSGAAVGAQRLLAEGIRGADARAFVAGAGRLIGCGEGLTPAGDDCLVGVLAALHRFAPAPLAIRADVRGALARAAETRTTAVARDFLLHALDGVFSEPLGELMTAASGAGARGAAVRLSAMGATSGADTLAGLGLALQALAGSRS